MHIRILASFVGCAALVGGCGDPAGATPPGAGGAAAGSATVDSGGTPMVVAGGAVAGGGVAPCEFACGGRVDDLPSGGTTPQAGSGGGASASGGAAGAVGAGSGCPAGVGLCDDFESYAEGKVPDGRWQTLKPPTSGASLLVDGSKPFSGSKSLHIKVTSGGSANIATKPGDAAFTGITNAGYLRFMMFQTAMMQPGDTHARLVRVGNDKAAAGSDTTGYAFTLHGYPKPAQLKIEAMNDHYFGKMAPVLDKWVCWEIQFGPGVVGWWMDGVKVATSGTFTGTVTLSMLEVGFETFTPITAELWIDDLAFDGKRVGCPTKP